VELVFTRTLFDELLNEIELEGEKSKETFSFRELVFASYEGLTNIIKNQGYKGVIAVFERKGIPIKLKTLQQYLFQCRAQQRKALDSAHSTHSASPTASAALPDPLAPSPAHPPAPLVATAGEGVQPDSVGAIAAATLNKAGSENGHPSTPASTADAPQQLIPHAVHPVATSPIVTSPIATSPITDVTHSSTAEVVHQSEEEERGKEERDKTEGSITATTPESREGCVESIEDGHLKKGNLSSQSLGADASSPSATAVSSPQGEVVMDGDQRPSKIAQPKLEDKVKAGFNAETAINQDWQQTDSFFGLKARKSS
jgi:hypothetical protein